MKQPKILIVDDEQDNLELIKALFIKEYDIRLAKDGEQGVLMAEQWQPDLILLDVVMPGLDGFQACLKLRKQSATRKIPIVFLTNKNDPASESFGLELGAEDFIAKPFDKEVLKSRIKKRIGALQSLGTIQNTEIGDCCILWDRQEVQLANKRQIPLTSKETSLLRMMVENRSRVLSREKILEQIWTDTYITDRTIDTHVKDLRKKIPPLVQLLKTIYGVGYRLDL